MQKLTELSLVSFCTIGLVLMNAEIFLNPVDVVVKKQPMTVVEKELHQSPPNLIHASPDSEGFTEWKFECASVMNYKYVEKERIGDGWFIELKITSTTLVLGLPLFVYMPKSASQHLKDHELGHVEICRRVYDNIEFRTKEIARGVMKTTYRGEGNTLESATKMAISKADANLKRLYKAATVDKVNNISEVYDFLQMDAQAEPSKSIEDAFRQIEAGKTRVIR